MSVASQAIPEPVQREDDASAATRLSVLDQRLFERLLDGEEEAFVDLVDRYHPALLRLAQWFVSDRSVAEEVAQETRLAVIKGLKRFEGRSSWKTWIFRILTNRAKSRGVREGRTIPFSSRDRDSETEGPVAEPNRFTWIGNWRSPPTRWEEDSPEKLFWDDETRALILEAIEELPTPQRTVVHLRDVEGWSSNDVCNVLDISETYQGVLLHRARTKVRQALESCLASG